MKCCSGHQGHRSDAISTEQYIDDVMKLPVTFLFAFLQKTQVKVQVGKIQSVPKPCTRDPFLRTCGICKGPVPNILLTLEEIDIKQSEVKQSVCMCVCMGRVGEGVSCVSKFKKICNCIIVIVVGLFFFSSKDHGKQL